MTPPPVIVRPERLARQQRALQRAATLLAWSGYAWLWVPLVTLVAWVLGLQAGWDRLYLQRNAVDPFILAALPIIALLCGLLLIGWAEYNRARFADADRRLRRSDVADAAVRERLQAPAQVMHTLRRHRVVTVRMDEQARPVKAWRTPRGP
ncbi:poly-beta-1,6-N-acetyl-D-glucosamine biosynthesis protein PgaD [Stenotrophomonas sp. ZAC14D1_NAIMI4_6]|uniref:poly-beta-1,6-N-acetyl-D-glucosamine biosynthesis protein PgaD n=1 Tax=unclassified Stenotrophomonas maltophilia group TaxID=2961925 RepID=UPI000D53EB67|nr:MULTISPECIES: poly-beta-1,6-N-acetyl-D-glucosamine biosynthesis protein PgaD [unclassified Stenotrophomonas maltophilia group]AWH38184.1 poly-beta-1,6-N-acetyl-D-glucosamine biosynthesis protein PgaD [Stenotrophomonas sp. ZAC14D1_NAIMI4_6]AWH42315.1 poly-beta-1,6-N-acetyl-D-glucosamine biosynthesis protein PgaD [Stenotrophomonas sp. ZAC14D1_NAIMI4_1]